MRKKLKLIMQSEVAECAHACLAMMFRYHQCPVSLFDMRRRFRPELKGVSFSTMIEIAEAYGFQAIPLKMQSSDLSKQSLPLILYWQQSHFVVLAGFDKRGYILYDPAKGVCRCDEQELQENYSGYVLEIRTLVRPKKLSYFHRGRLAYKTVKHMLMADTSAAWQLFCVSVLLQLVVLISPWCIQQLLGYSQLSQQLPSSALPYATRQRYFAGISLELIGFSVAIFVLICGEWILALISERVRARLSLAINRKMVEQFMQHLMALPLRFFIHYRASDMLSRLHSIDVFRRILTQQLIAVLISAVALISSLIILFCYSPLVFLPVALGLVIVSMVVCGYQRQLMQQESSMQVHYSQHVSHFFETFRAILPLKLAAATAQRQAAWLSIYNDYLIVQHSLFERGQRMLVLKRVIAGFDLLAVIVLADWLIQKGSWQFTTLYGFLFYRMIGLQASTALMQQLGELSRLPAHWLRLQDVLLERPEPALAESVASPFIERIHAEDLEVGHDERQNGNATALNFDVQRGELALILGPSASGKTTLIQTLAGLLNVSKGQLWMNTRDVSSVDRRVYQRRMAIVLQHDQFLTGTIRENIALGEIQVEQLRVQRCTRLAGLDKAIHALPMGYNSLLTEHDRIFSGGQRQQLLLARALYRQPDVLLLDEALCHVDTPLRHRLLHRLKQLPMMIFLVSHDVADKAMADKIIELV